MNFGFAFPMAQLGLWLGIGAIVMIACAVLLRWSDRGRVLRLERFVAAKLAPRLLVGYDVRFRRPLGWLTLLGVFFLLLTAAQPHWGQSWQEVREATRDVLIVLDTSESMRAEVPPPSRLERAKQKILSLIELARADRFGLVAFSGVSVLQCPLTMDHGYFKSVLDATDTDTVTVEGTDIASALREAVDVYAQETERTGEGDVNSRTVLLISDGEAISEAAVEAAERLSQYARLYVIGIGDPEGTEIRVGREVLRHARIPESEHVHLSKLDEPHLRAIAQAGRGGYIRTTADNSDVEQIHAHVEQLQLQARGASVKLRLVNRYQWPLAAAIACFIGEGLWLVLVPWVRQWRMRRTLASGGAHG